MDIEFPAGTEYEEYDNTVRLREFKEDNDMMK
jgi:hypothetical protein